MMIILVFDYSSYCSPAESSLMQKLGVDLAPLGQHALCHLLYGSGKRRIGKGTALWYH